MSNEFPSSPEEALTGVPENTGLRDFSLEIKPKSSKTDLNSMDQSELLALRDEIDAKITGTSLSEINLAKEALLQLQKAKQLQVDAELDKKSIPMNQRAQVQNSIKGIISDLAGIQMKLYDSEYVKRLKAAVVKVVRTLPKEQQTQFFDLMDMEAEKVQAEMGA